MGRDDTWSGIVTKKGHQLVFGTSLIRRRVTIEKDGGGKEKILVDRSLWKEINVGDRMIKEAGQKPRRA